jgi:hypothetical protein
MDCRMWRAVLTGLTFLAALAGCGDDSSDTATTAAATSIPVTSAPTTAAPATAAPVTDAPPPTEETPAPPTTSAASTANCTSAAILPTLRAEFTVEIVGVDIRECQNGYARVFAQPDQSTCGQTGGSCYENEQVFLRDDGGSWVYITSGTGIACTDPDLRPPELETACVALGLR